jgi:hypothetical protein
MTVEELYQALKPRLRVAYAETKPAVQGRRSYTLGRAVGRLDGMLSVLATADELENGGTYLGAHRWRRRLQDDLREEAR